MKFGTAVTFKVTVAVCVSEPLVPVIVNTGLPTGVPDVVAIVSVEEPEVTIEVGENEDVAPVGMPLTFRLTVPLNPLSAPTFTV